MILGEYKHSLDFPLMSEGSVFRWYRKLGFCDKKCKKI